MSTYYLISSLPLLSFDHAPLIHADAFLAACHAQLDAPDAAAAETLVRNLPASSHPFVRAWRDKDALLRNAVARIRSHARGVDAARWLRPTQGCDAQIERGVEEAFHATDPLKLERALDTLRWRVAEELQGYDPMSVRVVLAYAIKLPLALRWSRMDVAQGQERFSTLTSREDRPFSRNP